jgi:Tfp pilus assembly protein PilN
VVVAAGSGLLASTCAAVGFAFLNARADVTDKRQTLQAVQEQVASAQAEQASTAAAFSETQARLAAFTSASSARISWDTLLGQVSGVLPPGSWLSTLRLAAPLPVAPPAGAESVSSTTPAAAPVATTPTAFTVSGFALSQQVVARVMQRLALVPMLSDVTLQRSQRSDVGGKKAFAFTMSANVKVEAER